MLARAGAHAGARATPSATLGHAQPRHGDALKPSATLGHAQPRHGDALTPSLARNLVTPLPVTATAEHCLVGIKGTVRRNYDAFHDLPLTFH